MVRIRCSHGHSPGSIPGEGTGYSFEYSLLAQMVKSPPANAGDSDSIPVLGRSPGEGNDNPLQCFRRFLENLRTEEPDEVQSMWSHRVGHG